MTGLHALWLPIVLSAVAVFVLSSLVHMVLPWHKSDYRTLEREADVMSALRPFNLSAGDYMAPRPSSMADMKSPEFQAKAKQGPRFILTMLPPGDFGMASQLATWFVYSLVIWTLAAYVAGRALPPGASYLEVFRFAGVTTFSCYAMALPQTSIWYGRAWRITLASAADGLLYALFTAGIFGWLWPR